MLWGNKRYYALKHFLRNKFGAVVRKIAIDAGFTCPNRDGTLGYEGCIFCSPLGSGDTAGLREKTVAQQISDGIAYYSARYGTAQFIAYFQAFTNTYSDTDHLRALYNQALEFEEVVGISIATRPDCLGSDVLNVLHDLSRKRYTWVELGLQSANEETARLIKRRYDLRCFEKAVSDLRSLNIDVVCHTILGLPGETERDMVDTTKYLSNAGIQGIKFQLLHVIENTELAEMFKRGEFSLMQREDYVSAVADCLEVLSPGIVVHRLTGDGPKESLLGPEWSLDKIGVLQDIERELVWRDSWQGKRFR